jgi:hypothetical protein
MLSRNGIRSLFKEKGAIIAPKTWFYIWPPKEKRKCRSFAMSNYEHQKNMVENHRHLYRDKVIPYGVHLWGWEGSSFRKAK